MRIDPVHWVSKTPMAGAHRHPSSSLPVHWLASCVFALGEHCGYSLSPNGCSHSTAYRPGFQRNEVNDGPLCHRAHYIGNRRPRFFAIRQGCCSMHNRVGVGTILPTPCVPWPSSLPLPRFQSYNSHYHNPCEIAGYTTSLCRGDGASPTPAPDEIAYLSTPTNSRHLPRSTPRLGLPTSPER